MIVVTAGPALSKILIQNRLKCINNTLGLISFAFGLNRFGSGRAAIKILLQKV